MLTFNDYKKASDYIISKIARVPDMAITLGSGLGSITDSCEEKIRIPYSDIPFFPTSTVKGHLGEMIAGNICGKYVLFMSGRFHFYEGYPSLSAAMYARVLKLINVKNLLLTNAAGGINLDFKPGDLMMIDDHISFFANNPLIGKNIDEFGERFVDMGRIYRNDFSANLINASKNANVELKNGVYAYMTGPSFETPAEIKALRNMGADCVGMSTVPEAILAHHCGINVCGVSCISNMAAGILDAPLSHSEVIETGIMIKDKFVRLIKEFIKLV